MKKETDTLFPISGTVTFWGLMPTLLGRVVLGWPITRIFRILKEANLAKEATPHSWLWRVAPVDMVCDGYERVTFIAAETREQVEERLKEDPWTLLQKRGQESYGEALKNFTKDELILEAVGTLLSGSSNEWVKKLSLEIQSRSQFDFSPFDQPFE